MKSRLPRPFIDLHPRRGMVSAILTPVRGDVSSWDPDFAHRKMARLLQGNMISLLLLFLLLPLSLAGKDCVWILGRVQCERDPSKNLNVEVRVWDRDSFGPFKIIDPDDLMGVTFSNEDGRFQLDGCGDDFDWVPGLNNKIEPYIEIRHFCNNDEGEIITLPHFKVFVPETYDLGTIILDKPKNKP